MVCFEIEEKDGTNFSYIHIFKYLNVFCAAILMYWIISFLGLKVVTIDHKKEMVAPARILKPRKRRKTCVGGWGISWS
jgi:hypothetical protein